MKRCTTKNITLGIRAGSLGRTLGTAVLALFLGTGCSSNDDDDNDDGRTGNNRRPDAGADEMTANGHADAGADGETSGDGTQDAGAKVDDGPDDASATAYDPGISAEDFVDTIDHPYFPAEPGTKWVYEGQTADGFEQTYIEVLVDKRTVWGVKATVIRDSVYVDGELVEDTWDWYAEDKHGNVWYLGEDTAEYENGEIINHNGAWESGVDGALPGIVMPAVVEPGDRYYQEYYAGVAEDQGQIVEIDVSVDLPAGQYDECFKTHDTSTLDPDIEEYKTYCRGVGFVLEESDDERVELTHFMTGDYGPDIAASDLSTSVDNPLFPLPVGAKWTYEATTEDGTERIEVEVLAETKDVWGATATVVRDTVYLDDEVVEDTWDWYAQDGDGNVWYLGEDTKEYEDGEVVCACGSWETDVDGALPGIIMQGNPKVGDDYYQEYYIGEAEDRGEVVEVDVSVTVTAGSYTGCTKTRDYSAINPTFAFKTYCPGVGVVLEEEGDERVELIEYSGF